MPNPTKTPISRIGWRCCDQDIDSPGFLSQVGGRKRRRFAVTCEIAYLHGRGGKLGFRARRQKNRRPFLCEQTRDRASDPAARAGNERNLTFQQHRIQRIEGRQTAGKKSQAE
jgi:hypothetical protein